MKPNLNPTDPSRVIQGNASLIVGLRLKDKHVLVLGGGREAVNRTFFALDSDALVTLICPFSELDPTLLNRIEQGRLQHVNRHFVDDDLDQYYGETGSISKLSPHNHSYPMTPPNTPSRRSSSVNDTLRSTPPWPVDIVLSCLDDLNESKRIALLCQSKRIPVNCADIPDLCDFYFMANFRSGRLQIGVSTNGGGPRLGARIRNQCIESLDESITEALDGVALLRDLSKVNDKTTMPKDPEKRQSFIYKRMKWMSQLCDQWSYQALAKLCDADISRRLLEVFNANQPVPDSESFFESFKKREIMIQELLGKPLSLVPLFGPLLVYLLVTCLQMLALMNDSLQPKVIKKKEQVNPIVNSPIEQPTEQIPKPSKTKSNNQPEMILVGAGPGDPKLLTVAAMESLERAELVVADRLIPQAVIDLINPKVLFLSPYKAGGKSDESQNICNEKCVEGYKQGKVVVRLKTGDVFMYGRGAEEIIFFKEHDIETKVIPGLSSAFASPSSAMIPVTHRGIADSVLVLAGRGQNGAFPNIPFHDAKRTTVVLMPIKRIKDVALMMMEKGYPLDFPCAVIEKGTWKEERVLHSDLEHIADVVSQAKIESPAMWIIGNSTKVLQ